MKYLGLILISIVSLLPVSLKAQQTKVLTADKHNEYGLIYSLPDTQLEIEVVARHTVKKAGPYSQFAKKYLGITDVIAADSEHWEIIGVNVVSRGVPTTELQYLMQLKAGALTYINLTESGLLLAINSEVTLPEETQTETISMLPSSLDDDEYLQYMTEDFLSSQSSVKRAQMLAESIMEVRNAKISLSRGTAEAMPTDGRQLELMLSSLSRQEQSMTDAFTGTTQVETVVKHYSFLPTEDVAGRQILFRMSDFAGFVAADDYSGDPVYIDLEVIRRGELPVNEKGEEKKLPKDAVIYTIPGAAKVTLSTLGKTLYEGEFEIAQLGVNFGLNPSIFTSKKEPSYAIFDPTTGAVVKIGGMEVAE